MKHRHHPRFFCLAVLLCLVPACGENAPTGVQTGDLRGTWSATFDDFSLMGRTLSGDADWTFERSTFEIIFFNPPDGQAERIDGDWKFSDGRIVLTLKSSFPIDSDIGATDTLFVSILRDEMSLKTIADASILLVKTRIASRVVPASPLLASAPASTSRRFTRSRRPDAGTHDTHRTLRSYGADIRLPFLSLHPST